MAPISRARRNLYLLVLVATFAVATPILIGYARGYRLSDLGDALRLIRTGGVYVAVGETGVDVVVDGEVRETTTFLSRNALVQNLFAGTYQVAVSKSGYMTWEKKLAVHPEVVTEWRPALVPDPVPLEEIGRYLPVATSTSTSTAPAAAPRLNPRYAPTVALFATTSAATRATTTRPDAARLSVIEELAEAGRRDLEKEPTLKISGKIAAWSDASTLRYAWLGEADATPHYLCDLESCAPEEAIVLPNPVLWFEFAPGRNDLFVVVSKTGLWLVEADGRGGRNFALLVPGQGVEARVADGEIYVRQGGRYWQVGF